MKLPKNILPVFAILILFFPTLAGLGAQEKDPDGQVLATYALAQGKLTLVSGQASGDQARVWSYVQSVIPGPWLSWVDKVVFLAPDPDGQVVTSGYASLEEDSDRWVLGLNLTDALSALDNPSDEAMRQFDLTLLHEWGHILSLNSTQVQDVSAGTLEVDEGILKKDSWLNQFYQTFWRQAYPNHGGATDSDAEGSARYQAHPDRFVTDYAATGPLEDFAETFAVFVRLPLPRGKAVKDQKVQFLAKYPELVALREALRKKISTAE